MQTGTTPASLSTSWQGITIGRAKKSKKPSAASSDQPPDEVVFFVDRGLGRVHVATALRETGCQVVVHDDRFQQDTKDEVWLTAAGAGRWVVLTKDRMIRKRAIERQAFINAGVAVFVLVAADLDGPEMAIVFSKAIRRMQHMVRDTPRPFIALVTADGKVTFLEGGPRLKRPRA